MTRIEIIEIKARATEIQALLDAGTRIVWLSNGIEQLHLCEDRIPRPDEIRDLPEFAALVSHRFDTIESALREGLDYSDFDDMIDDLLGTTMPERDREAEAAWEGDEVSQHLGN